MRLSRALLALVCSGALSLALGAGINAMADDPEPAPQMASVVWDERPASSSEMAGEATVVVKASVTAIEAGAPLVSDYAGDDPGETEVPTQRVTFEAVDVLDGEIPSEFEVFKTGSDELYLQGDPVYEVDDTYVLFLKPQGEPGVWLPVAPDGRLAVDTNGELQPVIEGRVGNELEGLTTEQVAEVIQ